MEGVSALSVLLDLQHCDEQVHYHNYTKNIRSSSGRRRRNSTRNSLKRCLFMCPSWAVWCTRLAFVGETRHSFRIAWILGDICPLPYSSSATTSRGPNIIATFIDNTQLLITPSLMNHIVAYSYLASMTSLRFRSAGTGLASFTLTNIPSKALEMVVKWLVIFCVVLHLSGLASINNSHWLYIPSMQFFISSSIFTWFRSPRGLWFTLPSLIYRAMMLLAVLLFIILKASATWR